MYTVYILFSEKDEKRYIGCTSNLNRRLEEHKMGLVKSTKNRCPFKLIHTEKFNHKSDALKKEKFFKTGKVREYLKNLNK